MPRSLRLDGESDEAFQRRAEKATTFAKLLIARSLSNECVKEYIADPALPQWTEENARRNPIVRVEFSEATAIGCIGECLQATEHKHWGEGPSIMPLNSDDFLFSHRITYVYTEVSLYNQRFQQRQHLKALLGRRRPLVERARRLSKTEFEGSVTRPEIWAIQRILGLSVERFWRAVRGTIVTLPPVLEQGELPFNNSGQRGVPL